MKHLISLFALLFLVSSGISAQKRSISFNIAGAASDTVHLAYYVGNRLYYRDTAMANIRGEGTFSTEKDMPGGVYAIVVDNSKYFELIVNESSIEMHSSKADMTGSVEVKKSEENKVFYAYISFLGKKRMEAEAKRQQIKSGEDKLHKYRFELELEEIDKAVKEYQADLIVKHKDLFVADLVRMSLSVELEQPKLADGTLDSTGAYYQYRDAYWSNFNLNDPKIVGTPVFHNKLEEYVAKSIPQIPDTITKLVDKLIASLGDNDQAFKYVVHHVTHKYETSEVMGMDAVFAHMGLRYYCPDKAGNTRVNWISDEKLEQLCERVSKLSPLLIGKKAPYLKLPDSTEQNWISYYDLPQDYIVLIFWDPHCGACKKEMPILKEVYETELKKMNVEVFAVAKAIEEREFADWKKYIAEEKLDWINVGLTTNIYNDAKANPTKYVPSLTTLASLNYSDTWDVYSTPKIFVVDKDRNIVAKQLAAEQIVGLIKKLKEREAKELE